MPLPPSNSKMRNFVFTLNNWTEEEEQKLQTWVQESEIVRYAVWGREVGESGTPHLQGYVELTAKRAFNTVRRVLFDRAHIEKRRGSAAEAAKYCKKDGDFFEWGKISSPGKRTDIATMRDLALKGERDYESLQQLPMIMKYPRGWQFAKQVGLARTTTAFRHLNVHVLWGPGGSGKTKYVFDHHSAEDVYVLDQPAGSQPWFDGYDGQEILLLDDFYGWLKWGFFLKVLDGYQLRLPVKGAFTYAKWTKVYITSNVHPNDWYEKHSMADAEFKRRIHEVTMLGEEVAVVDHFIESGPQFEEE